MRRWQPRRETHHSNTVEIRPISLPDDVVAFVRSWWRIYRDEPHWVPPLVFERKRFLDPSVNPYFRVADVQCFLATRGGEGLTLLNIIFKNEFLK